jgi:curli biogenesis system outer membrane secretion channel CsgG
MHTTMNAVAAQRGGVHPSAARRAGCALVLGAGVMLAPLAGLAADPVPGGGHATQASGAAAGGSTVDPNSQLETCQETLGTISIDEQTNAGWYAAYQNQYKMGSTIPALRLIIQQSNCFVIVDRGRGLAARNREAALMRGEEGRAGSNYGGGQIAAADYTMLPEVILSDRGGTRGGAGLGGLLGRNSLGAVVGAVAGSVSTNEAGTILTLIDNRSTVQLAAAEGYSKNVDIGLMGGFFGGGAAGAAGAYTSTPQGKVIFAAFTDSYNKMVRALRNYKAQTVRGGLGTGGRLGVQGGSTDASREVANPR